MLLHSVIASVLIDCAFVAWDLRSPRVKQRFRFMVIFLPVVSFPMFQLLFPGRGDVYFRLGSLLDSNRWLFLEVWGGVPVLKVLLVIPAITAAVFVLQELVPIVISQLEQMREAGETVDDEVDGPMARKVAGAMAGLPFNENCVEIFDDEDLVLFSNTGFNPRIYVSTGLIKSFSTDHLQAAFAHEIGHIQRSRKPTLILAYLIRTLMFYNPVAMVEFRKLAQEEEKVCDDIAIALTGKPEAVVEAVNMLRPAPEEFIPAKHRRSFREIVSAFEQYSLDVLLKSRVQRIGQSLRSEPDWGVPYFITMTLIIGINYYVV
ncbi:MAG: M48 family metalloprotease [Nitrospirae bacterium]|nr:M48 family metalloprotease [Nitrospirota bacterium]